MADFKYKQVADRRFAPKLVIRDSTAPPVGQ